MIKTQKKLILIGLVTIVILTLAYIFIVSPMINKNDVPKPPELLEGEALGISNRIAVFPTVEKSDIAELEIHNKHGKYSFYYEAEDKEFYIRNFKGTPYESTQFSVLLATARNPLSMERVTTDAKDLSEYGLSKEDNPAWYKLITHKGTEYIVYVGDMIPTGGGYYCRAEGRNAVYILDPDMKMVLLPITDYITPLLSFPVSQNDYYTTERFTLIVDNEVYISAEYLDENEMAKTASQSPYLMLVPENYVPSSSNYPEILKTFIAFKGTKVLEYDTVGKKMPEETLAKYNLANPKYMIYYQYLNIDNTVFISEQNEDGSYYAYSPMFNLIATVDSNTLKFLNWDFIDFIDRPVFQRNINDIAEITIESKDVNETFVLKGENKDLSVIPTRSGKPLSADMVTSFRNLYFKMLGIHIEDYTESQSTDEWLMTLKVKTDAGYEYEYKFYSYSTRRCFVTINGTGEFYVLRDRVEQIIEDTQRIMNGEAVNKSETG